LKKINLELLGHACFSLDDGHARLLNDPWITGNCFNKGWNLQNEPKIELIKAIETTFVHITHEHPDHFHVPSLLKLNKELNPIFLIQKTNDKRVANFLRRKLGKKVIELKDGEIFQLSEKSCIQIYSHGHMDSFSIITSGGFKILNINDCVLKNKTSLKKIAKRINMNKHPDVLLSQYSFASYQGNKEEVNLLKEASNQHIEWVKERILFFKPKIFIPFASHINWCHEENRYLNYYSVKESQLTESLKSIINEDSLLSSSNKNISLNSKNNQLDVKYCLPEKEVSKTNIKDLSFTIGSNEFNTKSKEAVILELQSAARKMRNELSRNNYSLDKFFFIFLSIIRFIKPINIKILLSENRFFYMILSPGIYLKQELREVPVEIEVAADSVLFCLNNNFGAETLWVNSRFKSFSKDRKKFFKHFYLPILNNQGFLIPFGVFRFFFQRILLPQIEKYL
tara:strand:+ start:193 stop:1554 length:1362 start_codon:yes stop_codon:yes gene_type:complete